MEYYADSSSLLVAIYEIIVIIFNFIDNFYANHSDIHKNIHKIQKTTQKGQKTSKIFRRKKKKVKGKISLMKKI